MMQGDRIIHAATVSDGLNAGSVVTVRGNGIMYAAAPVLIEVAGYCGNDLICSAVHAGMTDKRIPEAA